ncbi:hypothetical protein EV421DRAFT_299318 [Armillaria borealis]|uniref:Secreted protein n=1 Tax=Armillaria borealis TaxID=47425 RepID=A0AA39JR19_9AGAR|nr:hypothetical protein EV421DRAFT_299318 [Armillaria borealis]
MSSNRERKAGDMLFARLVQLCIVLQRCSSGCCEVCCSLPEPCVFCIYLTGSLSVSPSDELPHGSVFTRTLRFSTMIIQVPCEA